MSRKDQLDKEILTKQEAANMLSVTITTLDRKVKCQGLPRHKPKGSSPYFLRSEILEWVKNS